MLEDEAVVMWALGFDTDLQKVTTLSPDAIAQRSFDEWTWLHLQESDALPDDLKQHLLTEVPNGYLRRLFKPSPRPALDEHTHALFVRFLAPHPQSLAFTPVHVLLFQQWLLTWTPKTLGSIDTLAKGARRGVSSWHQGTIPLAIELLDQLVDQYALVLNHIDEQLIHLEDRIMAGERKLEPNMFALQRHILNLRHTAFQHHEVCHWLYTRDIPVLSQYDNALLRLYNHMTRISDWSKSASDHLTGSISIYLGLIANQTNEVMRLLAIFTAVIMPLTLITGIYGMNFQFMPELASPWGYPLTLGTMGLITLGLLRYFRNKKWL